MLPAIDAEYGLVGSVKDRMHAQLLDEVPNALQLLSVHCVLFFPKEAVNNPPSVAGDAIPSLVEDLLVPQQLRLAFRNLFRLVG